MVAKICSDGTSSRSAAGEIHPALPKLRDQLQPRGRHGTPLYRETKRHRSRETVERIRQTAVLATITERIAVEFLGGMISRRQFTKTLGGAVTLTAIKPDALWSGEPTATATPASVSPVAAALYRKVLVLDGDVLAEIGFPI